VEIAKFVIYETGFSIARTHILINVTLWMEWSGKHDTGRLFS